MNGRSIVVALSGYQIQKHTQYAHIAHTHTHTVEFYCLNFDCVLAPIYIVLDPPLG
jgi:hypothetical protein